MRSFCLSSSALNFSASETILSSDAFFLFVIFSLELFSIRDHSLNVFLGQTAFIIGNGDLFLFAGRFVHGRNIQDTIGVNVKSDFDLGNTTRCWWNTSQVKLAKKMVISGHGTLTFIDLNGDSRLVVRVSSEGL